MLHGKDCPLPFFIHICYSSSQIRTLLSQESLETLYPDKVFIAMFDFDRAYSDWDGLKNWNIKEDDERIGLLKKSKKGKRYAFLLPIPNNRKNIASKKFHNTSMLEIELLFNDQVIEQYGRATTKEITGGTDVWNITSNTKKNIIENLNNLRKEDFVEFEKIFDLIKKIQSGVYR